MDEGAAAVLAALIAVAGVALGLFGARWQARGMQEQANAAIEAVRAQGRDQNAHWRRTVRRDVWVGYLGAVDEFRRSAGVVADHLVEGDLTGAESALDAALSRSAEAADAYRRIELEGPEEIVSKGYALQGAIATTAIELDQELAAARSMSVLEEARERERGDSPSDPDPDPDHDRDRDRDRHQDQDPAQDRPIAAILSSLSELQAMDSGDPDRTAHGQRVGVRIIESGLLSAEDTGALVLTCGRRLSLNEALERFPHGRWLRFHEVRTDFVEAARSHLDGGP
ncbi:hypothetical protein [Streptomyces silaceus]|uniref:hypothetical protein n=1 Tax=Streptomyces silaceus TaxID=545123 RepID=UPI0006EB65F4|nr:hypothetical protein [Streptomyces silaceus]